MASPGNQHCAKCIDTLSFPIVSGPRTVFSADHTNPNLSRTLLDPPVFFLLSVYNLYLPSILDCVWRLAARDYQAGGVQRTPPMEVSDRMDSVRGNCSSIVCEVLERRCKLTYRPHCTAVHTIRCAFLRCASKTTRSTFTNAAQRTCEQPRCG